MRQRDSIQSIQARLAAKFEARRPGLDAHSSGSVLTGLFHAVAAQLYAAYGHQEYIARQMFDATADDDELLARAAEYGITRINAVRAAGQVRLTAVNGVAVPQGSLLQTQGGRQYAVTTGVTASAGAAVVAVEAVTPGVAGNLLAGTALTLVNGIAGVDSRGIVQAPGLQGGADIERIERVRARLAERKSAPPAGGARHDYIAWAKAAHPSVTRVWVWDVDQGPGTVVVRFACDGEASPIPSAGVVELVAAYIEARRPAGLKQIYVQAPVAAPQSLVITALNPDTPEVRAAITAEWADLLLREGNPGGTLPISKIREAISTAAGEDDYVLASPSGSLVFAAHELPVAGGITWPA